MLPAIGPRVSAERHNGSLTGTTGTETKSLLRKVNEENENATNNINTGRKIGETSDIPSIHGACRDRVPA